MLPAWPGCHLLLWQRCFLFFFLFVWWEIRPDETVRLVGRPPFSRLTGEGTLFGSTYWRLTDKDTLGRRCPNLNWGNSSLTVRSRPTVWHRHSAGENSILRALFRRITRRGAAVPRTRRAILSGLSTVCPFGRGVYQLRVGRPGFGDWLQNPILGNFRLRRGRR